MEHQPLGRHLEDVAVSSPVLAFAQPGLDIPAAGGKKTYLTESY